MVQAPLSESRHRHQRSRQSLFVVGPAGAVPAFVPLHLFAVCVRLCAPPLDLLGEVEIVAGSGPEMLAWRYLGGLWESAVSKVCPVWFFDMTGLDSQPAASSLVVGIRRGLMWWAVVVGERLCFLFDDSPHHLSQGHHSGTTDFQRVECMVHPPEPKFVLEVDMVPGESAGPDSRDHGPSRMLFRTSRALNNPFHEAYLLLGASNVLRRQPASRCDLLAVSTIAVVEMR